MTAIAKPRHFCRTFRDSRLWHATKLDKNNFIRQFTKEIRQSPNVVFFLDLGPLRRRGYSRRKECSFARLLLACQLQEHAWNRPSHQWLEASTRSCLPRERHQPQGGCPHATIRWQHRPHSSRWVFISRLLIWDLLFVSWNTGYFKLGRDVARVEFVTGIFNKYIYISLSFQRNRLTNIFALLSNSFKGKQFGVSKARWPVKSAQNLLGLLKNAEANADTKGLDTSNLIIKHIQVNQAPKGRRRTYRAHGRVRI